MYQSLRLKLRIMSAKGDSPEYYNIEDKARIKQLIDDTIIPKLREGWTLGGAKKGDRDFTKIADSRDVNNPEKLTILLNELDRFMLEEGEKLLIAPVKGGND